MCLHLPTIERERVEWVELYIFNFIISFDFCFQKVNIVFGKCHKVIFKEESVDTCVILTISLILLSINWLKSILIIVSYVILLQRGLSRKKHVELLNLEREKQKNSLIS